MRHTTAAIVVLAFALCGGPANAAMLPTGHKCTMKINLIEKHLETLRNKYDAVIKTAPSETEARDYVKHRIQTLLVDVRRSLDQPTCGSQHRARLQEVEASLETMMNSRI